MEGLTRRAILVRGIAPAVAAAGAIGTAEAQSTRDSPALAILLPSRYASQSTEKVSGTVIDF